MAPYSRLRTGRESCPELGRDTIESIANLKANKSFHSMSSSLVFCKAGNFYFVAGVISYC